jgi:hypothetical protein
MRIASRHAAVLCLLEIEEDSNEALEQDKGILHVVLQVHQVVKICGVEIGTGHWTESFGSAGPRTR